MDDTAFRAFGYVPLALRSDLQNLNTAQVLLNRTAVYNKDKQAKIQRQVNFQNLLGENAESPVFAVAQALSSEIVSRLGLWIT